MTDAIRSETILGRFPTGSGGDGGQGGAPGTFSSPPAISLPKGGGAIRGMGEKFSANAVSGTGSLSVPLYTSPGRSGFGPQLSLSYDSGAGNGPFGLGWSLSLPSITRKTDKGLPRYRDTGESDVFILSGVEDLVPVLDEDGDDRWVRPDPSERTVDGAAYRVQGYRPRIEGLFARIERWTDEDNPENVFWRSISKDNVTTWYGKTPDSRVFDPGDPERIFGWLICESYDDKGNAIVYGYKREDHADVDQGHANERNRERGANRYLKRIRYGNRVPYLPTLAADAPWPTAPGDDEWHFEVVFDYGEHYSEDEQGQPTTVSADDDQRGWPARQDPFSTYRAGFEVRTYRLCRRVLMFHHFPEELGTDDYLVRSTEFTYDESPIASRITGVSQPGYVRRADGTYLKKSLPPLDFEYSEATIRDQVQEIDAESLENLPYGPDGARYQWVDLDGEGLSGILTEQAEAWFYKPNAGGGRFGPMELVAVKPSVAELDGGQQLLDLAGDGQIDLVQFRRPLPGYYERTKEEGWARFVPFESCPNIAWDDPNLRFVDLTGDGHADVLITEDDVLTWYPSLAENGFDRGEKVHQAVDEERGPRLILAEGTQSIHLADLSGDGLTDLVRIRDGEVCYWPNLGYGRFGAKVTMDHAPHFDAPDQFDQRRIRLADIDGSGVTDIIYLGRDGVRLYFNQSGNSWSGGHMLTSFPQADNLSYVVVADLRGNGTACLVWSSPLPGDARRPMRYVDLMGGQKPHLLVTIKNNLGAETRVRYAASTKFYVEDREAGKPWITKVPFPVHVVEQVETYDHISRNRFVTRYAYHHGYFDGAEREFRGFGMVEQWDTEEIGTVPRDETSSGAANLEEASSSEVANLDEASYVPPVHTRSWFHTGVHLDREHVSRQFEGEYYREPGLDHAQSRALPLDDTVLPPGLTLEEEREACRALKGALLRQEVYALDGTGTEDYPLGHPYTVTEQNFTVRRVQPRAGNRHAVFFTHSREAITHHYERRLVEVGDRQRADPRVSHAMTLEVDRFGNVLRSLTIGYPRANVPGRQPEQNETHLALTLNRFRNRDDEADWYRAGLPVESRSYEVVKPPAAAKRFAWSEVSALVRALVPRDRHEPPPANTIPYEQWDWREHWDPENEPGGLLDGQPIHTRLRILEHVRTLYRPDDLGATQNDPLALLPLGTVHSLALPGESYKLALTRGLLAQVYRRPRNGQPPEILLPNPDAVLRVNLPGDRVADRGGYVDLDGDGHWWVPSGRTFYSPNATDDAAAELAHARQHFFLPHRYRDPFGHETTVGYDSDPADPSRNHNLLVVETKDALDNVVTVKTKDDEGRLEIRNDYRVLQPYWVTDPNGNRTQVAFDALGMVVGTAVMGKPPPAPAEGDSLEGFDADLTQSQIDGFYDAEDPRASAQDRLKGATTRIVYDLDRFRRTQRAHPDDPSRWLPAYAATLARETHLSDSQTTKIQITFSYSDGFGREIQKKIQAEPGPLVEGGPVVSPRWVGSGWTIFNNKGNPVRQYEPFFSQLSEKRHQYEFGVKVGVSPILFYDPVGRVVATLHPDHTYEKVVFDPWQQTTFDANDTVTLDPSSDDDVKAFFIRPDNTPRIPESEYLPTWHGLRTDPAHAAEASQRWPDPKVRDAENRAAEKAKAHENTPTVAHFDTLGRPFLTVAHNRFERNGAVTEEKYPTRVELDVEGNQRQVRDALVQEGGTLGRVVMRYDYDMLGNFIHQASMDAGERWVMNDVADNPIRSWDSRGFLRRMTYNKLRRSTGLYVTENGAERLAERTVYGESLGDAANHRTRVHKVFDGAGVVTSVAYDFKGNLRESRRDLLPDYKQAVNWLQNPIPNDGSFTGLTAYNALNRPLAVTSPDGSVYRPTFNEANLLDKVDVHLRGAVAATPFVTNIDYDAKGQRTRIAYNNGALTTYEYDPLTLRLTHLKTTRPNNADVGASQLFKNATVVQDLSYTYDPVGNITRIEDAALKTIVHAGEEVEAACDYTYDALYRLSVASGREHGGQTAFDFNPPDGDQRDNPFAGHRVHANNLQGLRGYVETYRYDAVGNILHVGHHAGSNPDQPGQVIWKRNYQYALDSNRLLATSIPGDPDGLPAYVAAPGGYSHKYGYDAHGNMTRMPHLPLMRWDSQDQLGATSQQVVNDGTPETTYYAYDAAEQRARKVTERHAPDGEEPARKDECIYLGGFEIYREYGNGATVKLERQTLHIMADKQRIALVETKTVPAAGQPLMRYQIGNHLGSASLELDKDGGLITYEEYHPYGTTAFQAKSAAEVSLKRYRYTGKERDEESGLYYHGARYYAPWLGRWTAPDPLWQKAPGAAEWASNQRDVRDSGSTDPPDGYKADIIGTNLYAYVNGQSIVATDQSGLSPTKDLVTTASRWKQAFEHKPTIEGKLYDRGGTTKGSAAEETLKKYGETTGSLTSTKPVGKTKWMFPISDQNPTGESKRYIYTKKGGWIDMAHFLFYAGRARMNLEKRRAEVKEMQGTWRYKFWKPFLGFTPESDDKLAREFAMQDTLDEGYAQETLEDLKNEKETAFTYEDLPSDKFGADFGMNFFDPASDKTLAEQIDAYLQKLNPAEPQEAPNLADIPDKVPSRHSVQNKTFEPMYTKEPR